MTCSVRNIKTLRVSKDKIKLLIMNSIFIIILKLVIIILSYDFV